MPDQSGANNMPETVTQESPMPSEDQKTIHESPDEVAEQSVQPSTETTELPDGAKERTREEFEKLKAKLRDERNRREYLENAYKSLTVKEEKPDPVYDPNTGLINENALTDIQRRAIEAERRAQRAEQAIQNFAQMQEEKETFSEFPELDPSSKKFDRTLHRVTRSILIDSNLHPEDYEGRQLKFVEAARFARNMSPSQVKEAEKRGAQQAIEGLTPKEQASLEATGMPSRRQEIESDLGDLRYKTRKGDLDSIIARMKRTG